MNCTWQSVKTKLAPPWCRHLPFPVLIVSGFVYRIRERAGNINVMNRDSHAQGETSRPDSDEQLPGKQSSPAGTSNDELMAELKRRLEETRLPANLKEQILGELPPPEERERLFRELLEEGGLSSEQFLASLGLEAERQP